MCVSAFVWRLSNLMALFCSSRIPAKKQIPNPSKYFHTLHSVHDSNLKVTCSQLFFFLFTFLETAGVVTESICTNKLYVQREYVNVNFSHWTFLFALV